MTARSLGIVAPCLAALLAVGLALAPEGARAGNEPAASDAAAEQGDAGEHHGDADRVEVTPEQRTALGIDVAAAGPGRIDSGIELQGEVRPNGDRLAHIVPRFPGIVRDVRRTAGDAVVSGDVLAVIESSDSLAPYELRTLIDGVVLTRHLTRGEAVDREKQAFVIADLSTVWVDLAVYQKDLGGVHVGQEVRIHAGPNGREATGTISYLTPAVDPATRTATARVVLPNPERAWLPGFFVIAHTTGEREAPVVVPRSAIQTVEGSHAVFVEEGSGFEARPVLLGEEGDQLVEVAKGLAAGERIAVRNTFLLKAELAKGEAEHAH